MTWRKRLIRTTVDWYLSSAAFLLRHPLTRPLGQTALSATAKATIRAKRISPARDLAELGQAWQHGFPSAKQVPITAITADTVFAEIHTPCPLRGSQDVLTCHHMMAYDRQIAEAAGGQFKVLRSQAESGVTVCQVALRRKGQDMSDLREPHERP